ncbi:MAG TPA: MYXO-CTERM sorting domain-containing protein [Polyangiaceae bacterium]|nr:MYXO-CTERM sorting domain-containing protein [Polyangiaceae bacterium]
MRWLSGVFVAFAFASVAAACSSGESRPAGNDGEAMGSVTQAITTACNTLTVGLPCDPDGPAGPKLECEGVCYVATTGLVGCIAVAAGTLNGVTCGTAGGVGDAACTRYCSGKTCLAAIAPLGTACRPNLSSDPCDGQCDGTGKCDSLGGAACAFGRDEQLCTFATCNFSKATQCKTQNLNKNTLCSDSDACSIGKCSTGVCVAGPAAGCDDGNSCTDDACDSVGGGCVGTPNNANSCSDGNACLTGEHCAAGKCVAGTTPVNCDDSNACTADSCDPNTGCAHIAKSCSDSDACTADSCDPATGACSSAPISCADADPCTVDACDPVTGCSHVNMNCDDADACTADSCANGTCGHATVSCDDNDACTTDSCDALSGCTHVAIVGCGGGGDGGAGGIGSDGNAGAAAGGASDGGAPPTGGTAGSETGGTAGTEAGGTAGTEAGGTPSAGTASGGNSTAGTTSAGSPSGGTESSGGTTATGGTSTPEGGAMDGGTTGSGPRPVNDSGCGCRVPAQPSPGGSAAWALGLLGLTALLRRRRAV